MTINNLVFYNQTKIHQNILNTEQTLLLSKLWKQPSKIINNNSLARYKVMPDFVNNPFHFFYVYFAKTAILTKVKGNYKNHIKMCKNVIKTWLYHSK